MMKLHLDPAPTLRTFVLTFGCLLGPLTACHKDNSTSSVSSADQTECPSSLALTGDLPAQYDFVFPDGIGSYEAGTKVLQLKTGRTYECKGFPYTPYCRDWTVAATRFEPGTGSNWMAAWDLK